jgi:membrane fusion protein (multidrug efflux system)
VETLHQKGYAAKRDLEQAHAAEKQARASVDAAKGQLAQANAQLKNIEVKLRETTITAPFSGTVSQRFVDPGAYVSPSTPIITLVDDSSVKAIVNAVEEDFPRLALGAEAEITADAFPGEPMQGTISRIPPAVDAASRTAPIEIRIVNKAGKLRTGMTVRVGLAIAENPQALAVPEAALKKDVEAGKEYVFLLDNGKARRADVESGIAAQGFVEIRSGISTGDQVITSSMRLNDGMAVQAGGGKSGGPR